MRVTTRLPRPDRGVSTVVGAVLAILILIAFLSGTYLWTFSAQRRMRQLDEARSDEDVELHATFDYDAGADGYVISVWAENTGSEDVQVIRLWVVDEENNEHSHVDLPSPVSIPVGSARDIPHEGLGIDIADGDVVSYVIKAVTKRGNTFGARLIPSEAEYSDYPIIVVKGACQNQTSTTSEALPIYLKVFNETSGEWVYVNTSDTITAINGTTDWALNLTVWNDMDESIALEKIIVTNLENGAHDVIEVDPWVIGSRQISSKACTGSHTWRGEENEVYEGDILIELLDDGLTIVGVCVLTVHGAT